MRHAIDEERNVQRNAETKIEIHPERGPEVFVPEIPRHQNWHTNGQQSKQWFIQSLLPHNYRIGLQIAHVDDFTFGHHFWVRRQEEPGDMSEEETSSCIVRISICL